METPIQIIKEGEDGQLVHDGLTEQQLLMLAEIEAEEEEKHAVAEFKRRLDFNMGRVRALHYFRSIMMHAVHSRCATPRLAAQAATALLLLQQPASAVVKAQVTSATEATSNIQLASVLMSKP